VKAHAQHIRDDECEAGNFGLSDVNQVASERSQLHQMSLSRDNKCISEHSNVGEHIDYHRLGFVTHSVE
jgi:hypothetical protein